MAHFWVAAPCGLVEVYRRFTGPYCFHHHLLFALMKEAPSTFETLVNFRRTTRSYNPHLSHLQENRVKIVGRRSSGMLAVYWLQVWQSEKLVAS
jgi:hypothetical protein